MPKAHLRIDNDLFQAIMICDFSKRQMKIINLIYRLSVGCQREWARIPYRKDFEAIGITKNHITHTINWLINTRVILNNGDLYKINPEFDQWKISPVDSYEPEQLNNLIKLNLNGSQNGNSAVPKTGTETPGGSQNGNSAVPFSGTAPATKLATAIDKSIDNSLSVCLSDRQQRHVNLYVALHKSINPQIISEITSLINEGKSDAEIDFVIHESAKHGGKSANYLRAIIENRETEGKTLAPPPAASAIMDDGLQTLKKMPAPDQPPQEIWGSSLKFIQDRINKTSFDSFFMECTAVRWQGRCIILRPPKGMPRDQYTNRRSVILEALINSLGSKDVDFEIEEGVYAKQT